MFKIGIGQDSHPFDEKKKSLMLGGIVIDECPALGGDSDGDAVLHALCNALNSAVGKGSLSTYSDKMCRNGITDSSQYVAVSMQYIDELCYSVHNISIAIEAQRPKLEHRFPAMKERIAHMCTITPEDVGITATTGEWLTSFGRGEGVQVFVIVLLCKK